MQCGGEGGDQALAHPVFGSVMFRWMMMKSAEGTSKEELQKKRLHNYKINFDVLLDYIHDHEWKKRIAKFRN